MKIQDITIGQYTSRDSFVHTLDPRTKVALCILLMILTFYSSRLITVFSLFIVILALHRAADLNPFTALRNLRPFLWLFLITGLIHLFLSEGRILYKLPGLDVYITEEGLRNSVFYNLRIAELIVAANFLTLTTSPMALTDAIERSLRPLTKIGIPVHEIAIMLSIAIRFIPLLIQESDRIRKAQVSRGSRFEGTVFNKIKQIVPLIIPLFLSAFRKASDLALAMDARCYRGGVNRTSYVELKFHIRDAVASAVIVLISIPVFYSG